MEGSSKSKTIIARLIKRGHFRHIFTTNYDQLIEHALQGAGCKHDVSRKDADFPFKRKRTNLIKLHGSIDDLGTIVIAEDDYLDFSTKNQ